MTEKEAVDWLRSQQAIFDATGNKKDRRPEQVASLLELRWGTRLIPMVGDYKEALVLAAPELYEALKFVVDAVDGNWAVGEEDLNRAKAALAKARGETS